MKKMEVWQDFIPRGVKSALAEKYQISRISVTRILEREDVINHPQLVEEARKTATKAIEMYKKHADAVSKITPK